MPQLDVNLASLCLHPIVHHMLLCIEVDFMLRVELNGWMHLSHLFKFATVNPPQLRYAILESNFAFALDELFPQSRNGGWHEPTWQESSLVALLNLLLWRHESVLSSQAPRPQVGIIRPRI